MRGGAGAGAFREGGETKPKDDNMSSVRSIQGSTKSELVVESDCLPARRFLVAFSS